MLIPIDKLSKKKDFFHPDRLGFNHFKVKFERLLPRILCQERAKLYSSSKGRINKRKLFKHSITDEIFFKATADPTINQTLVILLDVSSSMDCEGRFTNFRSSRLGSSLQIISGFAAAVNTCLKDKLKLEIFTKSNTHFDFKDIGLKYSTNGVGLGRIFSNLYPPTKEDFDFLLGYGAYGPTSDISYPRSSATPEFLVLPLLSDWINNNLVSRKYSVLNVTDGQPCGDMWTHSINGGKTKKLAANLSTNAEMRKKYLKNIPLTTLFIAREQDLLYKYSYGANRNIRKELEDSYGRLVFTDKRFEEQFIAELSKMFRELVHVG